jgi:hypothetical protein
MRYGQSSGFDGAGFRFHGWKGFNRQGAAGVFACRAHVDEPRSRRDLSSPTLTFLIF